MEVSTPVYSHRIQLTLPRNAAIAPLVGLTELHSIFSYISTMPSLSGNLSSPNGHRAWKRRAAAPESSGAVGFSTDTNRGTTCCSSRATKYGNIFCSGIGTEIGPACCSKTGVKIGSTFCSRTDTEIVTSCGLPSPLDTVAECHCLITTITIEHN